MLCRVKEQTTRAVFGNSPSVVSREQVLMRHIEWQTPRRDESSLEKAAEKTDLFLG